MGQKRFELKTATVFADTSDSSHQQTGSPLNQSARHLLTSRLPFEWEGALCKLLDLHWTGRPRGANALEPRLDCFLSELFPPAAFAEMLRRTFAPALVVPRSLDWCDSSDSQAKSDMDVLLEDWQAKVLNPFCSLLERRYP
jgi:hypothetical protein